MHLVIPLEIPSQNVSERRHWSANRSESQLWENHVRYAMRMNQVERAKGPRSLVITAYRKRRITDAGNLIGGAKGAIDAMVRAGLLIDDRDEMARIEYHQELVSKSPTKKPCTVVSIQ